MRGIVSFLKSFVGGGTVGGEWQSIVCRVTPSRKVVLHFGCHLVRGILVPAGRRDQEARPLDSTAEGTGTAGLVKRELRALIKVVFMYVKVCH